MAEGNGVDLGPAYLSVIPSFDGIEGNIGKMFGEPLAKQAEKDGKEAGNRFGETFGSAAKLKVAAAGVAVGAALMSGFGSAIDAEKSNNKLTAQLALTSEESARYGKLAGDMYANNYGESVSDVNGALKSVVTEIGGMRTASDEELAGITKMVMSTADTFDQDLGGTARAVGKMLSTGMAPDAEAALDTITVGLQKVPGAGEDLLDTFNEYSVHFKELGLNGPAALGFISSAMAGGARDTDIAADALKEFSLRAQDMGDKGAQEAFEALGFSGEEMAKKFAAGGDTAADAMAKTLTAIKSVDDPVKQTAITTGLLGTQSEDLASALLAVNPKDLTANLGKLDGAAAKVDETVGGGTANSIQGLQRAVEGTFGAIATQAMPILGPFLGFLTEFAPILTPLALGLGLVAAAQWVWNLSMWAWPGTWIILGIAAVVAGVIWLINNWDVAGTFLMGLWNGIASFFTSMWEGITFGAKLAWEGIANFFGTIFQAIVWMFLNLSLVGLVIQHWDKIWAVTQAVFGNIGNFFSTIWTNIANFFGDGVNNATNFVNDLVTNVTGFFDGLVSAAYSWGSDIIGGLLNGLKSMGSQVGSFFGDLLPEWITGPFTGALDIHSPSRVFRGYGEDTGDGYLLGIAAKQRAIKKSMEATVQLPDMSKRNYELVGSAAVAGGDNYTTIINPSKGMSEEDIANIAIRKQKRRERR